MYVDCVFEGLCFYTSKYRIVGTLLVTNGCVLVLNLPILFFLMIYANGEFVVPVSVRYTAQMSYSAKVTAA